MSENPYDVLGLDVDATTDEINAAFRAKAKGAHPDQGGSTEEFNRVKNASLVLLDPVRRRRFDETGKVDDGKADNHMAEVMEAIANFFISSLDVLDQPMSPRLADTNLVQTAVQHFNNQIAGANQHIKAIESKIGKFEKTVKRLKTKREDDVVGSMLHSHINRMKDTISRTRIQITQFTLAVTILNDYEFEPEEPKMMPGSLLRDYRNWPYT